jgi:hypothetical protein
MALQEFSKRCRRTLQAVQLRFFNHSLTGKCRAYNRHDLAAFLPHRHGDGGLRVYCLGTGFDRTRPVFL